MMEMKSILMKRTWEIGEGFNDTADSVKKGLAEILDIPLDHKVIQKIGEDIEAVGLEGVFIIKNNADKNLARVTLERFEEEKDIFGDIVPAHAKVTYLNLE